MMNVGISILNPSGEPAWQDYVNCHPDATIYHTLEWRDILYDEYRFEPVYLIAKVSSSPSMGEGRGEGERVVGVLPIFLVNNLRGKRLVSLPFSIYGGPLGENQEVVSILLKRCIEMVKEERAVSVEIKSFRHIDANIPGLISDDCGIGTTLDLIIGVDALWERRSDKNTVNKAIREGLSFVISDGEGIEKLHELQLFTRKRHGLPTPSLNYYRSFFDKLEGRVKLALVEKEGIPVAGGLFFIYNGVILYALGASDQRYSKCRPNDLLIWEMVKWGCENGFKTFDLGPISVTYKGLAHFKGKWRGNVTAAPRYYYPSYQASNTAPKGSFFFKSMPTDIAKIVGPRVIRFWG